MKTLIASSLLLALSGANANDDARAHGLWRQQQYSSAAALFSDDLWRGVAFYRAGLWLQAAESFAKSHTLMARYNLANSYAHLGEYQLALDTYQQVLADAPGHADAQYNANLMKTLLAKSSDENPPKKPPPPNKQPADDKNSQAPSNTRKHKTAKNNNDKQSTSTSSQADGNPGGGQPGDRSEGADQPSKHAARDQPSPPTKHSDTDAHPSKKPEQAANSEREAPAKAGEPEAETASDKKNATFLDTKAQKRQALQQWMSTIEDRPERFLKARIAQSIRQRQAAGTLAQPEGAPW